MTQGVKAQAHMATDDTTAVVFDGAGLVRNVAAQKFTEGSLANEADAGGVFFARIGQPDFVGDLAHLRLAQLAHGEPGARELRLIQAVQKIALVFGGEIGRAHV